MATGTPRQCKGSQGSADKETRQTSKTVGKWLEADEDRPYRCSKTLTQ